MTRTAIIGVGSSVIKRRSDREIDGFAFDAAVAAIADAGIALTDIDGYIGAPSATSAQALHVDGADELSMRLMAGRLGLDRLRWSADLYWDFVPGMIVAASHALAAGACTYVLAVRALHNMLGVSANGAGRGSAADGEKQAPPPVEARPVGARFAMRAGQYLARSGATRRDLYDVVALARDNASRNPLAVFRGEPLSLDEYLAAPIVAEPLGLFDCDMPVCGAVAFVLTRADLAARAPNRPVYVAGSAGWQQPEAIFQRANRSRGDVQLAQLYDGFSPMMFEWLERLGWCDPDTGWQFFRDGHAARGGKLPVNSFGGSLGEGRLHGAGHVREAVLQLSGRAGARQIANAENCLVQVGPHDFASLLMLSTRTD